MSSHPHPQLRVGIEKIRAYPCTLSLDLADLARARDHDPADLHDNLLVFQRSVNPLWEDPVTMATNAAGGLLDEEDRQRVRLLVVGTESSVDQGKALSTYLHRFLGLGPSVRNFEVKQACYGATGALSLAASWVLSGVDGPDAAALVIATDQSRMNIGEPYEFVNGAGAVAMLVGRRPRVIELEPHKSGYWTHETADTFRPTSTVEMGNGETSLYCYLDALEGAYVDYVRKNGGAETFDFGTHFKKNIYHVPFGGITFQAHRTLLRHYRRMKKSEAWAHFAERSLPALHYNKRVGAVYSGSTFLALMGLIDACDDLEPGDRVGMYSYGSGSIGELYHGIVCPEARQSVARSGLAALVEARRPIDVALYERLERARHANIDARDLVPSRDGLEAHYRERYEGQGLLVLEKIENYYRTYRWS